MARWPNSAGAEAYVLGADGEEVFVKNGSSSGLRIMVCAPFKSCCLVISDGAGRMRLLPHRCCKPVMACGKPHLQGAPAPINRVGASQGNIPRKTNEIMNSMTMMTVGSTTTLMPTTNPRSTIVGRCPQKFPANRGLGADPRGSQFFLLFRI